MWAPFQRISTLHPEHPVKGPRETIGELDGQLGLAQAGQPGHADEAAPQMVQPRHDAEVDVDQFGVAADEVRVGQEWYIGAGRQNRIVVFKAGAAAHAPHYPSRYVGRRLNMRCFKILQWHREWRCSRADHDVERKSQGTRRHPLMRDPGRPGRLGRPQQTHVSATRQCSSDLMRPVFLDSRLVAPGVDTGANKRLLDLCGDKSVVA